MQYGFGHRRRFMDNSHEFIFPCTPTQLGGCCFIDFRAGGERGCKPYIVAAFTSVFDGLIKKALPHRAQMAAKL